MAKNLYDIITIGSATRDVFLVSKAFQIIKSPRFRTGYGECVSFGSKIDVDEMVLTTGGGGTNAAATFASLGFDTAVVTRIGNDSSGKDVLGDLAKFGVKSSLVKKARGTTGFSVLLTAKNGERSVLVHRGVSAEFEEKDVPMNKLRAKWLYMTSLAGNTSLALKVVRAAHKHGTLVAFNPGSSELKKGMKGLDPILRHLTLLNLNFEEAQKLARSKSKDIKTLCQKIVRPGLTLVITDCPRGAYAHLDGTTWFVRPRGIKAVSRTGAGDAFGSGLVAALARDKGIDEALCIGVANAESVIQSYGAKTGILQKWPTEKEMKRYKVRTL